MYLLRRDSAPMLKEPISSCCTKTCCDRSRLQAMHPTDTMVCLPNEMVHNQYISRMVATMRYNALLRNSLPVRKDISSHILKDTFDHQRTRTLQRPIDQNLAWRLDQRRGMLAMGMERRPVKSQQKCRTTFSMEQVARLEEEFQRQQYIVAKDRRLLSREIGISELQVKVWFQNRRIKWRKQQLEHQSDEIHENISNETAEVKLLTKTEQE